MHEGAEFRVEAVAADLDMDGVAQLLPTVERAFETRTFDRLDAAVESDPGHHLAVREVPLRAAHLPDAFVGPLPGGFHKFDQGPGVGPAIRVDLEPCRMRMVERVDDFSINVQLKLIRGGVADAHGRDPS